ncbi:MAG: TetR/AcrR family transcriptional regulator C-terminal domain-containing protein [Atopobiaceae bacterium]|nr:TetR/AcrR family transcriptional regulator C-terminal domain-containing protein [Atopobiaceae bacterium]
MEYRPGKAERTKAQLGEAVISLLTELQPDQITADAIAERAGMGRATWFRHFSSKSDAVACALVARWMRWATDEDISPESQVSMLPFLRLAHAQRETLTLLYARGMRQAVLDASARITEVIRGDGHAGYRSKFFLYGFVGVLDEWVRRDFAETPEEIAAMLGMFSPSR